MRVYGTHVTSFQFNYWENGMTLSRWWPDDDVTGTPPFILKSALQKHSQTKCAPYAEALRDRYQTIRACMLKVCC